MLKKIFCLLCCIVAFALSSWAGGTDYYYKVTATAQPTGAGKVYVASTKEAAPADGDEKWKDKAEGTGSEYSSGQAASTQFYLYAKPAEGYVLVNWTKADDGTTVLSRQKNTSTGALSSSSKEESKPAEYGYIAHFSKAGDVYVVSEDETVGTAGIDKPKNTVGDAVTLTAYPDMFSGTFKAWTKDGKVVSTDNPYTFTVDEANKGKYVATFTKIDMQNKGIYCYVHNVKFKRSLGLMGISDKNVSRSNRYLKNSIMLLEDGSDIMRSSPAFVLKLTGSSDGYGGLENANLEAQGVASKDIAKKTYTFSKHGDHFYIYGSAGGYSAYMIDYADAFTQEEHLGKVNHPGLYNGANENDASYHWVVTPISELSKDFCFGAMPSPKTKDEAGKYYTTMYTKFPYRCLDGVKAYVVSSVDTQAHKVVLSEIKSGEVPSGTPVVLECTSTKPVENRLLPLVEEPAAIDGDNLLKGEIWLKDENKTVKIDDKDVIDESKYRTKFDSQTMLVLSNDELAFKNVNNTDVLAGGTGQTGTLTYIANNTCYLKVSSEMTEATTFTIEKGETKETTLAGLSQEAADGVTPYKLTGDDLECVGAIASDNYKYLVVKDGGHSTETMVARIEGNDKLVKMVMLETVDPTAFRGSGTQDDPYLISDKDDLKKLNEGVTVNAQTYLGDYFKQTNDIDLENATDFVGVGTDGKSAHNFAGTYDGQGYTIHRLYIDSVGLNTSGKATPSKSRQYAGFFGYIGPKGVVKNLNIASDCHFYVYGYVGAIAGYNKGTIENCRNYANVTAANAYAGGIAGYQDTGSKVAYCYNSGTVTAGSNQAAGIVPYSKGTTTGCQNDGHVRCVELPDNEVMAPSNASGIVGNVSGTAVLTDNINTGTVEAYRNTAGIAATVSTGALISRNINYGIVINGAPNDYSTGAFTARDLTTVASGYNLENNYYDKQLGYYGAAYRAPFKGINGLLSRQLTSGEALEGIDAQQVDFAAGQYPVLKRFKDEPAAVAHRNMVVTLPDDETIDDVRHTAALSDTASWSLVKAQQFAISDGNRLTVTIAGDTALRDTLTASLGGYTKVIPLRAQPIAFAGSGTKADPYQIRSKADMLLLASYTNDADYAFTGRYFKVMNDIDFDTTAYVPVAVTVHKLDADFDGNGKKFLNINYTSDYKLSTGNLFALIGNVGENGRVHNVNLASGYMAAYGRTGGIAGRVYGTVDSCESHITVSTTKDVGFGGIAGRVMGGGKVTNCKGYAKFEAKYNRVGGIVYDVLRGGLVENCENYSDINAPYSGVAGIAAQNAGTISNCVNHGAIAGKGSVAGIVGTSLGGDVLLNCRNEGTVTATGSEAGGILASTTNRSDSIIIAGCSNMAAVTANKYAGGLVGYAYVKMLVDSCYNTGDVSTVAKYAAGLLSYAYTSSRFTHCYNTGTVIGGGDYAGGLIGDVNGKDFVVSDCVNYGDVMGSGMYGAGISSSYEGVMERVVNYGHVESDSYAAGITGYASDAKYVNCVNYGDVAMTGTTRDYAPAGGLMALNRASSMTNCYNLGKVTSTAYASGLIGDARDDTSYGPFNVRNCYTAGEISGPDSSYVSHVTASTDDEVLLDSVYYDITVNRTVPYSNIDSTGIALSTREMVHAALGDAYVERVGMYPVLAELADSVLSNWYAATVVLPEGFGPDSVAGPFIVGNPEGTTWTASPEIVTIDGNVATPTATGEVTLTKTCGTHSRSYRLVVTMTTGVTDVDASDAAIVAREYFNLNGQSLGTKRPESAGIYIERDRYSNGAGRARKIVVK